MNMSNINNDRPFQCKHFLKDNSRCTVTFRNKQNRSKHHNAAHECIDNCQQCISKRIRTTIQTVDYRKDNDKYINCIHIHCDTNSNYIHKNQKARHIHSRKLHPCLRSRDSGLEVDCAGCAEVLRVDQNREHRISGMNGTVFHINDVHQPPNISISNNNLQQLPSVHPSSQTHFRPINRSNSVNNLYHITSQPSSNRSSPINSFVPQMPTPKSNNLHQNNSTVPDDYSIVTPPKEKIKFSNPPIASLRTSLERSGFIDLSDRNVSNCIREWKASFQQRNAASTTTPGFSPLTTKEFFKTKNNFDVLQAAIELEVDETIHSIF